MVSDPDDDIQLAGPLINHLYIDVANDDFETAIKAIYDIFVTAELQVL